MCVYSMWKEYLKSQTHKTLCISNLHMCMLSFIAKKSLRELQQVCLKLKEEVFSKPRAGFAFNTNALEKTIIEEFGRDMIMSDIKRPK